MTEDKERESLSRTNLAEDRTILANERTFAGWMRTSLAAIAIGVGFNALFARLEPPSTSASISSVMAPVSAAAPA